MTPIGWLGWWIAAWSLISLAISNHHRKSAIAGWSKSQDRLEETTEEYKNALDKWGREIKRMQHLTMGSRVMYDLLTHNERGRRR